jgi:hypothetical protein
MMLYFTHADSYGGFLSYRATPFHHPFIDGFSLKNHPAKPPGPTWQFAALITRAASNAKT